ncbi:hypothetical protein CMK22_09120 [Candidatus Poribacteria bacterium]|nr:hypothetical protein [Candidatus Poribacteria bacterium]
MGLLKLRPEPSNLKILTKYTIREFVPPFFASLLCLTLILLLEEIFRLTRLFVKKGVSPFYLLELLIYVLPATIVVTIPMSTLIGILIAFGRLSTDNEITAMRAHGVSFQQLLVPMLITSIFLSITDLVFMDYALPHGNAAYSSLKRDISRKNPSFVLEEGVVMKEMEGKGKIWMFERTHPETGRLLDVKLWDAIWSGKPRFVESKQAVLSFEKTHAWLDLYDGRTYERVPGEAEVYRITSFEENRILLDVVEDVKRSEFESQSPRSMPIAKLRRRIRELKKQITPNDTRSYQAIQLRYAKVEYHKKFSIPFACLFFGLIGVPLGLMVKKSGRMVGLGIGLTLIVVYYLLLQLGQSLGINGKMTAWVAMWTPNMFTGLIGCVFLIRSIIQDKVSKTQTFSGDAN